MILEKGSVSVNTNTLYKTYDYLLSVEEKDLKNVIAAQSQTFFQILTGKARRRTPAIMMFATQSKVTILSISTLSLTFTHTRTTAFTTVTIMTVIPNMMTIKSELGKFLFMSKTSSKK